MPKQLIEFVLTEQQKKFLDKIPEDKIANIHPWDKMAADFARSLVKDIRESSGLEVFWEGSLALGIPGENDIDLYLFSEPHDFDKHLPSLRKSLGEPTYVLEEKVLWRITKDGHKIDASLISPNSATVKKDMLFYSSLKENPELLKEYIDLKIPGMSAREYYRRKNEFYNRVTGIGEETA